MTKTQAFKEGKKLLKQMNGLGGNWKLHVWENLGWHYALENKRTKGKSITLYADTYYDKVTYSVLMGDMRHAGVSIWSDSRHSKDPMKAVKQAIKTAEKAVSKLQGIIVAAKKTAGLK